MRSCDVLSCLVMQFVSCTYEQHAIAILDILNDAIVNTTALYDYEPRSRQQMSEWFARKRAGNFPVIGAVDQENKLLGFASYGTFRAWPAFKYSVEHSVYVHRNHWRKGVGRALLQQLIVLGEAQQYHTLIGGIDAENQASIALHEQLGFCHAGTIRQAGFKFGRWLDLAFYQRLLQTPIAPVDG